MKYLILLFSLSVSLSYAQQSNLISTRNYLETGELDKAKEAINQATDDEQTRNLAKTWYYRGIVYHAIYETQDEKYKFLHTNPLEEASRSYLKALEFDTKKIDLDDLNMRLHVASNQLLNKGVKEYNQQQFEKALAAFESGINICKHFNITDTLALYNAAIAAENIGNLKKAEYYYKQCIAAHYGGAKIYSFLISIYKKERNKEKVSETIKQGRKAYPNEQNLILEELNYYLENNQYQEAKDNLNIAIKNDPNDATLYYSRGTIFDRMKDIEQAKTDYSKAIELDSTYFDALYNIGALYYNRGVELNNLANNITDNVKFKEEKKRADDLFRQSLPYFEKAQWINPNDRNTLLSLQLIYEKMGNLEKYEEMTKKLKR